MIKGVVIDWLINQVIAWIARWLDQNQPTAKIQKGEKPVPILKPKNRRQGIPGFDSSTGTWGKP